MTRSYGYYANRVREARRTAADKQPAAKRTLERAVWPYASRLTFVEALRAIVRARAAGQLDAAQERAVAQAIQDDESCCWTVM